MPSRLEAGGQPTLTDGPTTEHKGITDRWAQRGDAPVRSGDPDSPPGETEAGIATLQVPGTRAQRSNPGGGGYSGDKVPMIPVLQRSSASQVAATVAASDGSLSKRARVAEGGRQQSESWGRLR